MTDEECFQAMKLQSQTLEQILNTGRCVASVSRDIEMHAFKTKTAENYAKMLTQWSNERNLTLLTLKRKYDQTMNQPLKHFVGPPRKKVRFAPLEEPEQSECNTKMSEIERWNLIVQCMEQKQSRSQIAQLIPEYNETNLRKICITIKKLQVDPEIWHKAQTLIGLVQRRFVHALYKISKFPEKKDALYWLDKCIKVKSISQYSKAIQESLEKAIKHQDSIMVDDTKESSDDYDSMVQQLKAMMEHDAEDL